MSELNPYASPAAAADVIAEPADEMIIASQGQRFANFIIDQIIVRMLAFAGGVVVGIVLLAAGMLPESDDLTLTMIDIGIGVTLFVGYFVFMEPFSFLGSKNPAGWHDSLSGTRVVKLQSSARDRYLQNRG